MASPPRNPSRPGRSPAPRNAAKDTAPRRKAPSSPLSPARGRKPPRRAARKKGRRGRGAGLSAGFIISLVGFLVLAAGAALWFAMEWPPGPRRITTTRISPPQRIARSDGERSSAVIRRALQDMAGMPYEEVLTSPVEEGVKQVDFALAQAMARRDVPLGAMAVTRAELRENGNGGYHFQQIHIAVGNGTAAFVNVLGDALRTQADRAELSRAGRTAGKTETWVVRVDGVPTHELVLDIQTSPVPGGTSKGPGRVLRRRQPGAPARLVIVMDDLGQSMPAVRSLLSLPYPVTFAVWPYSSHAREAANAASAAGREVIVHQPMEPMGYPEVKPGPGVVLSTDTSPAIAERIRDSLRRVPHAVGLNNHMGSRFTRDARCSAAVLGVLRQHGLFMLDSLTHPGSVFYAEAARLGVPGLRRDVFLDVEADKHAILRQLRRAEEVALVTGQAVAIGHPLPETLAALKAWRPENGQVRLVRLGDLLR